MANRLFQSRALHAFLVVAQELHFGNAARRLNISQPPLSQQIRRLEETLGVALFVRSTRSVQITAAGALLARWARQQVAEGDALLRQMQRVAQGDTGAVNLGFSSSVAYRFLPRLLSEMLVHRPGIAVHLTESYSSQLIQEVRDAVVDIALLRRPAAAAGGGLRYTMVEREPLFVALPAAHRLAGARRLSIRQLDGQPFIDFRAESATYFRERTHSLFAKYQIKPRITHESAMPTVLALVQAGVGLALVPSSAQALYRSGIRYRPMAEQDELCSIELYSVRREDEVNPAVFAVEEILARLSPVQS